MTIKPFPFLDGDKLTVEPKPRMVGGRLGYAFHRFPIKGGISVAEAMARQWGQAITDAISRPSYFNKMLASGAIVTKGQT